MFCKAKDGIKFSFGLRPTQQNTSAFSTPQFPSIQIAKDSNCNPFYPKAKSKAATERIQMKKPPSQIYKELGGGGIQLIHRDKKLKLKINHLYIPFFNGDGSSIDKNEAKSVKSAHLSNQKEAYRSENKKYPQSFKNKNFHSFANILELRRESQFSKRTTRIGRSKQTKTQFQSQSRRRLKKGNIKDVIVEPQLKNTKKVVNNFFQITPMNIEMRSTKKENRSSQRQQTGQRQKSKIFKSYFQKTRPTLRISSRILNNKRLQTIVKDCDEQTHSFF